METITFNILYAALIGGIIAGIIALLISAREDLPAISDTERNSYRNRDRESKEKTEEIDESEGGNYGEQV